MNNKSDKVQIDLPCGRSVLVDIITAKRVQKTVLKREARNIEIARELKQEHMLPSGFFPPSNVKWISASSIENIPCQAIIDNRCWQDQKTENREAQYQEHLKRSGL